MTRSVFLIMISLILFGCGETTRQGVSYSENDKSLITKSLFKSDSLLISDEAISKILSGKLVIPKKARIAIIELSNSDDTWDRYREDRNPYFTENQIDTLSKTLYASDRISEILILPNLLLNGDYSISKIREASARAQADLAIIYTIRSRAIFQDLDSWSWFGNDKVRASSICEIVLIDTRTGIFPYTTSSRKEIVVTKDKLDVSNSNTKFRAISRSAFLALNSSAESIVRFFNSLP